MLRLILKIIWHSPRSILGLLWIGIVGRENYYILQGLKWPWYRVLWWLVKGKRPALYVPRKQGQEKQ